MRITQGTFSYLPDLTDAQISAQLRYALDHGWSIMLEYTAEPHPRNSLWEMWDQPMFDLERGQAELVLDQIAACRAAHPEEYVKVAVYDRSLGRQTTAMSFIVNRPSVEPGFRLERQQKADRQIRYTIRPS